VPGNNDLETLGVDRAGLDELEQARLVLGPSGLERDGGKVLGRENPRRRSFHLYRNGLSQGFFDQRTRRREELHRPSGDDDIFSFYNTTSCREVILFKHKRIFG